MSRLMALINAARVAGSLASAVLATLATVQPASVHAATPAPAWSIHAVAMPTYVSPTAGGNIVLLVSNHGALPTDGSTVTITDTLPAGLTVAEVSGSESPHNRIGASWRGPLEEERFGTGVNGIVCGHTALTVTCTYSPEEEVEAGKFVPVSRLPGDNTDGLVVTIKVASSAKPGILLNAASVSGGGAPEKAIATPVTISAATPPFGLNGFNFAATDAAGGLVTQAGAHPSSLTVGFDLNSIPDPNEPEGQFGTVIPVQPLQTASVELPLGFLGNPQAAQKCPQFELARAENGIHCPAASIVGAVAFAASSTNYEISLPRQGSATTSPLFNTEPEHGYPAEFAFNHAENTIFIYASVAHTPAGYVLRATTPAVPQALVNKGVQLTFFGDPALRDGGGTSPAAFFTNPVDCSGSVPSATIQVASWAEPSNVITQRAALSPITGCNRLHFEPTLAIKPEITQVDAPTGLTVDLKVPQNEDPEGLATPELKNATITLPPGMSVSPPVADGLQGCPAEGANGIDLYAEGPLYADEPGGPQHLLPGHCPTASQLGTVKVTTPLLASPLDGHLYLAQPGCQPCSQADAEEGRMVGLYLEVEGDGVNLKLRGALEVGDTGPHSVQSGLQPGQLRVKFLENPQLPFSDLVLTLPGGAHAPLATPQSCGQATTTSTLEPWSSPETATATPTSFFNVDWNGNGELCPAQFPFAPVLAAGTTGVLAGQYSPFTMTVTRKDREQDISSITLRTPPGLLANISEVPRCPEPRATQGTCGPESLVGHTHVAVGPGTVPFWVEGRVYLTGPYKGAPFGLSIVVPAKAGPFDLGNVVVRAAISVDPATAALSVASDALPQMVDGVPLRLRTVNVTIDRPKFTLTPTNCAEQQVIGTLSTPTGATATSASRFAVAGCSGLVFKPSFTVLTHGHTSKQNGAYLHVKVRSGAGQANIAKVRVVLPVQLPSRLSTLQKACVDRVFKSNPAACPPGAVVGSATAITPILKSALTGPAYLVSHGGAAFPDLVILLQGEGVALRLVGNTDIKKGITTSTFETVPDAPISTFDLVLPEGPHSALGAIGGLCSKALTMPTKITGQNGAVLNQTTRIAVAGCRHKAKLRRKARRR